MLAAGLAAAVVVCGSATAGLRAPASRTAAARRGLLPGSFAQFDTGPRGGTVWQGVIPNRFATGATRASIVYLPPGATDTQRYPVLYILHGLPGSPYSISNGLRFAEVADPLIGSGSVPPFIAVMPVAGTTGHYTGEWTGPWEDFVVHGVVPWVDAHLPTLARASARAIAGLSAGGFGSVDIGLRHPTVFGTLESWSGYFRPLRDGTLRNASPAVLAANDPTLLTQREAPLLRRLGTRFFLSCGSTHDRVTASFAQSFARELADLRLSHRLFLAPGGHDGRFWRRQLPEALVYALRPPA